VKDPLNSNDALAELVFGLLARMPLRSAPTFSMTCFPSLSENLIHHTTPRLPRSE
jgi:hypothetical protein